MWTATNISSYSNSDLKNWSLATSLLLSDSYMGVAKNKQLINYSGIYTEVANSLTAL